MVVVAEKWKGHYLYTQGRCRLLVVINAVHTELRLSVGAFGDDGSLVMEISAGSCLPDDGFISMRMICS